ncbi:MAG: hypothetical protein ACFNX4_03260 [Actinomyces oris]|jgi:hypothetical protein|uniref:hypothetical protein n=1 Tax=Actinomyces oris TaxID=544580 RepID=UPI0028EBB7BC|nr:hypothetical protein [Actinomyces oris]
MTPLASDSTRAAALAKEETMGDIGALISAFVAALCAIGSFIGWLGSKKSEAKAEEQVAKALESAERQAKALEDLASQSRDFAQRAERAVSTAQNHAESASRSAEAVEIIASTLKPAQLTVEWISHSNFALRNTTATPIAVTALAEPEIYIRQPLDLPAEIAPLSSIRGTAVDAWGCSFPNELKLIVEGTASPVVVPTTGRPQKS